jgi:hypothetical protein
MKLYKSRKYLLLKWLIVTVGFFSLHACKTKNADCFQTVIVSNYTYFRGRRLELDSVRSADSLTIKVDTVEVNFDTALTKPEFIYIPSSSSDSLFAVINPGLSFLSTPLNPATDSIQFLFRVDTASTVFDTITYFYEPITHFINNACGYTYFYNLKNVKFTTNMFDSAAIIAPSVTGASGSRNVNLYFKRRP